MGKIRQLHFLHICMVLFYLGDFRVVSGHFFSCIETIRERIEVRVLVVQITKPEHEIIVTITHGDGNLELFSSYAPAKSYLIPSNR